MISPLFKCTANNQNSELVLIKEHVNTIDDYVNVEAFKTEEVIKLKLTNLRNITGKGYEPVYLRSVRFSVNDYLEIYGESDYSETIVFIKEEKVLWNSNIRIHDFSQLSDNLATVDFTINNKTVTLGINNITWDGLPHDEISINGDFEIYCRKI